ncbi:DUF4044 domain-containing protein [Lacticaseibacillus saniviri]|nr:DUF4044 domain-containing protein [Lacticaseibacillus saniviri]MCG4282044.1 DUF4044 domain-containing protein [Lacticaseibacillus saniviri]
MKKKKSTFTRVTQTFVWIMLIITILGSILGVLSSFQIL